MAFCGNKVALKIAGADFSRSSLNSVRSSDLASYSSFNLLLLKNIIPENSDLSSGFLLYAAIVRLTFDGRTINAYYFYLHPFALGSVF
jgi:hypothetical protein